ncbi:hypothetical protein AVEN_138424-1 [Araneus ventricosus]|uniref:Uncharacterized protein n=1 Tax=Araneus ventricosus TaxID=182803 RepID=A0A4Y2LMG9_ARAVE|nr:hypothetical protein AVEN_138424-1 [Araneus ventricosus]
MTTTTPELTPSLQTLVPHQREDVGGTTHDLTYNRPTYTADLQWNPVSNLQPSGSKVENLPLDNRDPPYVNERDISNMQQARWTNFIT